MHECSKSQSERRRTLSKSDDFANSSLVPLQNIRVFALSSLDDVALPAQLPVSLFEALLNATE